MNPNMHVEGNSLVERLRAIRAKVFLLVSGKLPSLARTQRIAHVSPVNLKVTTQISFVVEGLSALWAVGCKFFRSTMNRHVVLEIAQLRKLFITLAALVFRL